MKILNAVTIISFLAVSACSLGKPSDDDCEKFADHMVELTIKEVGIEGMEDVIREEAMKQRPEFVKACKEEGTKGEVDCALKADSLDALAKCE
jgi:hypothetical protein